MLPLKDLAERLQGRVKHEARHTVKEKTVEVTR